MLRISFLESQAAGCPIRELGGYAWLHAQVPQQLSDPYTREQKIAPAGELFVPLCSEQCSVTLQHGFVLFCCGTLVQTKN